MVWIGLYESISIGCTRTGCWFGLHLDEADQWALVSGKAIAVLVNQKQAIQTNLQPMDVIEAGGCQFYYLKAGLVVSLASLPFDLWIQNSRLDLARQPRLEHFHPEKLPRQMPRAIEEAGTFQLSSVESPSIFAIESPPDQSEQLPASMASPAGMIAISSLASVLSGFVINPANTINLVSGLVSASITASAFAGWYGWNTYKRKQQQKKARIKLMNAYLAYLEQTLHEIEALRMQKSEQFLKEKETLLRMDCSTRSILQHDHWKLPIGMERTIFGALDLPKIPWQMNDTASRQAIDQLAALKLDCLGWQFLEQGSALSLASWNMNQVQWLALFYAWQVWNENRRLAWIGFQEETLRLLPCSMLEGRKLCFASVLDFLSCKTKYPAIEWTIISKVKLLPSELAAKDTLVALWPSPTDQGQICPIFPNTLPNWQMFRQASFLPQSPRAKVNVRPACLASPVPKSDQPNLLVELAPGLFWDLKREGPHALIAGSTGSGKSEGLCSILFQLAFQNKARALQYVLIDFKGGSFSTPFADLPHTAAMLTNLTGAGIERMEEALKLELDRRQEAVSAYLGSHPGISGEIEVCMDPADGKPFSDIIICVDEFGQLKSRYPEFMKSLQETARIGRSLGIHLVLSTQKPAGLVDEQIWANSKSRLCFPVLDAADSREVLGHDKASKLKHSGEFYLQCGNEIEKTGRAFYLKEPADGSSIVQELDDQSSWQEVKQLSLQEAMRRTILSRKEKRDWLLVPDPRFEAERLLGIYEDKLNRLEAFKLSPGRMTFLCGNKKSLERTAIMFGALWPDAMVFSMRSPEWLNQNKILDQALRPCLDQSQAALWQLENSNEPLLVVVELTVETSKPLIEMLCSKPNITLLLLCERIEFRQEKILMLADYRMAVGLESRDQCALLFEGKLPHPEPPPILHLLDHGRLRRLVLGNRYPDQIRSRRPLRFQSVIRLAQPEDLFKKALPNLICVETASQKPCQLENQTLTIAWSSVSGRQPAYDLAGRLQMEDPLLRVSQEPAVGKICLLDLSNVADATQALSQAAKVGDILFIGKGLSNYSYMLQITLPIEIFGTAILIRKGLTMDVLPAGLADENGG